MTTFTDGPSGDTNTACDTQLNSGQPELCLGTHSALAQATVEKSLIRFILEGIPAGAICDSATLYLYKYNAAATPSIDSPTTFYHIADANGDWVEGVTSNPAGSGHPCWEAKEADGSGGVTTAWAGSEGMSTAGTDYESSPIGSFTPNRTDAQFTEYQISLDTSVVESWFGESTNNGIMFVASVSAGVQMCSSDFSTASYRPKLVIEYTESGGTDNLTATDITAGTPVLDNPTIGQVHGLTAGNIESQQPVLDNSTIGQAHTLAALAIVAGAPVLDSPILGRPVITPNERTFTIDEGGRNKTIGSSGRVIEIGAEDRSF